MGQTRLRASVQRDHPAGRRRLRFRFHATWGEGVGGLVARTEPTGRRKAPPDDRLHAIRGRFNHMVMLAPDYACAPSGLRMLVYMRGHHAPRRRGIQYSPPFAIEPRRRGVLDHPLSRMMTS